MNWKRYLFVGFGIGMGIVVGLGACVGAYAIWSNRPKRPMPWNAKAIICNEMPGFSSQSSEQTIELAYELANETNEDYRISSGSSDTRLLFRTSDGSLTEPFAAETVKIKQSAFLPAEQVGTVTLVVHMRPDLPKQRVGESDDDFHERLRAYCLLQFHGMGFVLFDEKNKYEIDLTNISSTRRKNR
jgi:hypothetical protein